MVLVRRTASVLFAIFGVLALFQCGRRGSPSGGPKDTTPPVLVRADPPNGTTNFTSERIRLYFDEYIRLEDLQNQLIVSPPLKYPPEISPMGGTSKYVQVILKDTLRENTTYTLNFGQSVVDNNEGNPYSLLTYVFSTGDYLDSLSLTGAVADAFNRAPDPFISVMLYEIDSVHTDSTVYLRHPTYLTNTLDSAVIFQLNHLKAGRYQLIGLRDEGKDNVFNANADKIGFVTDTITLPTDSTYLLRLFRERAGYSIRPASFAASNRILFPYTGKYVPKVNRLTPLPDSVRTLLRKVPEKDSLHYWFTPFEADSLLFVFQHPEIPEQTDTLTVKPLDVATDSLRLTWSHRGEVLPLDSVYLETNTPLVLSDTSRLHIVDQDTLPIPVRTRLDSLHNRLYFDFEKRQNQIYNLELLPGAVTDFFGETNDSVTVRLSVGSPADFGTLRLALAGDPKYPLIIDLTDQAGKTLRRQSLYEAKEVVFRWLRPATYRIRVIFDSNGNGRWDTGNYLDQMQPERVAYYPSPIELRANWEKVETFTIRE